MKRNVTENDLITNFQKLFSARDKNLLVGIGDDAAVVYGTNKLLVYTCDSQVENVHFIKDQITPYQLGIRAVSSAVSDICAMGAIPKYLLVSLFLPKGIPKKFVDDLNKEIAFANNHYKTTVVGGNIAKAENIALDIFVIGETDKKTVIKRSGAKAGDVVCVTGTVGDSHAGWELLRYPKVKLSTKEKQYLRSSHFAPMARLIESQTIANSKLVTAMIDTSDGVSTDLLHLCDASSVGAKLFADKLPMSDAMKNFYKNTNQDPIPFALSGGEDFELLFTIAPNNVDKLKKKMKEKTGTEITVIGEIIEKKKGRMIVFSNNKQKALTPTGFDHLA